MADAMPDVCVVCVLWGGGDAGQASPQLPPLGLPATTPEPPAQLRLLPPGVNTVPPPQPDTSRDPHTQLDILIPASLPFSLPLDFVPRTYEKHPRPEFGVFFFLVAQNFLKDFISV